MAKRSIKAQIEELSKLLEDKRNQAKGLRGADLSRAEERMLRLECALTTLQWVRDHADGGRCRPIGIIRQGSDPRHLPACARHGGSSAGGLD